MNSTMRPGINACNGVPTGRRGVGTTNDASFDRRPPAGIAQAPGVSPCVCGYGFRASAYRAVPAGGVAAASGALTNSIINTGRHKQRGRYHYRCKPQQAYDIDITRKSPDMFGFAAPEA